MRTFIALLVLAAGCATPNRYYPPSPDAASADAVVDGVDAPKFVNDTTTADSNAVVTDAPAPDVASGPEASADSGPR